jgi:hypothetical protein
VGNGSGEEFTLENDEPVDVSGPEAPARLGAAAEHTEPGARCVQEDTIEGAGPEGAQREVAAIGDEYLHRGQAEAAGGVADPSGPSGAEVGGEDEAVVAHGLGHRRRLAAGSGGHVEDALAGTGADGGGHRLAGLVLGGGPTFGDGREPGEVADAPDQ